MADQAITALPKKTYSGSSKIAATDYLLGIDSAEGYQMLIQDLGEYIINRVTASLAGSTQTLASAISALNSKLVSIPNTSNERLRYRADTDCNLLIDEWALGSGSNYPPGGLFWYIHSIAYVANTNGSIKIGKQIAYGYSVDKVIYERTCSSGVWNEWTQLPTRSEVDALNSKIQIGSMPVIASGTTETSGQYISNSIDVTFSHPFDSTPSVILQEAGGNASRNYAYRLNNVTATGFSFWLVANVASYQPPAGMWIAIAS